MSVINDLRGRVRKISGHITNALRTEASDNTLAGWGQFLETTSPVFQIGPYGTASAVLTNQIAFPDAPVDVRVKAQLQKFWDERDAGKLYPQNVRLAFTVLSLARASDPDLIQLRNDVLSELRGRQLEDGSWSDGKIVSGTAVSGQVDATAWSVLALLRAGAPGNSIAKGAAWLADRVQGSGSVELISNIGVAAAVSGHANSSDVSGLHQRAFEFLRDYRVGREESISFFDFERVVDEETIPMRDYLCFPAFYPVAILINALSEKASFIESIRLDAFRTETTKQLINLTDGSPYKLPTARFSSLVDQAIYALSFEHLASAEQRGNKHAKRIAPFYIRGRNSILIRLGVPVLIIGAATATVAEPSTIPASLHFVFGSDINWIVEYAEENKAAIRILTALLLVFLSSAPKTGLRMLRDRILR